MEIMIVVIQNFNKMRINKMKNKRGVIPFYIAAILIAGAIIAILMITIFVLKGKGFSFIDQIKDLFKGGRVT